MLKKTRNCLTVFLLFLAGLLILKPKARVKIEFEELDRILKNIFGKNSLIWLVDSKYKLTSLEEMKRFLEEDQTDTMKYISDYRDCDDSAFRLKGAFSYPGWSDLAVGWTYSNVHAYNSFVDDKKVVYLIEPQSDRIFTPGEVAEVVNKVKKERKLKTVYLPKAVMWHTIDSCVQKACEETKALPLKDYIMRLRDQLEKERIGSQLGSVYLTQGLIM